MKFRISSPRHGQKRVIKRFAFTPQEITDNEGRRFRVWFELYDVEQRFEEGQEFVTREWVDVDKIVEKRVLKSEL